MVAGLSGYFALRSVRNGKCHVCSNVTLSAPRKYCVAHHGIVDPANSATTAVPLYIKPSHGSSGTNVYSTRRLETMLSGKNSNLKNTRKPTSQQNKILRTRGLHHLITLRTAYAIALSYRISYSTSVWPLSSSATVVTQKALFSLRRYTAIRPCFQLDRDKLSVLPLPS